MAEFQSPHQPLIEYSPIQVAIMLQSQTQIKSKGEEEEGEERRGGGEINHSRSNDL